MNNREIDALVAEKVMGWLKVNKGEHGYRYGRWVRESNWHYRDGRYKETYALAAPLTWSPSTDIEAAWRVIEEMKAHGKFLFLENDSSKGRGWNATFEYGCVGYEADAPIAPLAICLAALKAVGVEVPQ